MKVVARNARNLNVNRHQDHSQAWVLESTGLGSLESPIETRRGFTVRVARKEVRITLRRFEIGSLFVNNGLFPKQGAG